ncbi:MAG: T9SS type A sorting domain-containing protein, partial [candidate division Zixibacteria bacterium]|nr:T9SS type A sorting domain-containing protein [candidate division Zixibacteria bacterium]
GDIQWRRTYGWTDYDVANSIEQTADGGYIVAGYSYLYGWERAYIAKTDTYGDTVWFSVELHQPYKYFTCAKQTIDGGYIALGLEATGDRQYHDGFHLLKYSPTGNKVWTRRFGALPRRNNAYDLLQTPDGGFIAVGYGFGGVQYRAGLVRTDLQGNLLWGRLYPTGTESSELHAIEQTAPNEFAAAGRSGGDFWLMKLWEPAYCCEVEMITDDEPILVQPGGSFNYLGVLANPSDAWLMSDLWIGVIYQGEFFQLRFIEGTEPLEPQQFLTRNLTQNVPDDAPVGNYRYIAYCGNYPFICDSAWFDFTVVVPSLLNGAADWELLEDTEEDLCISRTDIFLSRNHPNPFNATTAITYQLPEACIVNLDIYNLAGQRVASLESGFRKRGEYSVTFDASNYSSGIYFYRLTAGERMFTKRMMLLK